MAPAILGCIGVSAARGATAMVAQPKATMTVEEYLAFDRASDIKHEYYGGEVFAMTGGSPEHSVITMNVGASLHAQLRRRPCIVYSSDQRVRVSQTGLFAYPDVTVVCGKAEFGTDRQDTLLNPTLIVEVLSPTTERYDRGLKSRHYRTINSLREYILIAQDAYQIEHYVRQEDGSWHLFDAIGSEAMISLSSINCTLALGDVYEKVEIVQDEDAE
jgi:Uma2 family endonuclease